MTMTPFDENDDDLLPEEHVVRNEALGRVLTRVYQRPRQLTSDEQNASIARIREHLLQSGRSIPRDMSEEQAGVVDSTPLPPRGSRRRIAGLVSGLAAVLVIGALLGVSVLLLTRQTPPTEQRSGNPSGLTVVARSTVKGLTMTLAITPGPYFLSEMLAVRVTLTNNSAQKVYPGMPFTPTSCGYYAGAQISSTENPQFPIPIAFGHSCPPSPARTLTLPPGRSLDVQGYLPLQQSGRLTLTAPATFYTGPTSSQVSGGPTTIPNPFGEQGLAAHVEVSSTIPQDRRLSFRVEGYNAIVEMPAGATGPLLYAYSISCQDYNNDGGSTASGNYRWDILTGTTVRRPGCPGKNLRWTFAFAIPGYAIAVGRDNDPVTTS